jgi:sugar lactone lactonase YvrE
MFAKRIVAMDYNTEAGTVSNRRTFVDVPAETGLPDGLIVDADGFVWSAHWGGSRVTRYDPDGKIQRTVPVPVSNVTCMGFGGPALADLYITTAWFFLSEEEREAQPRAGDVFRMRTDVRGLVEPEFAG